MHKNVIYDMKTLEIKERNMMNSKYSSIFIFQGYCHACRPNITPQNCPMKKAGEKSQNMLK